MAGKKSSENMTALPGAICEPGGVASTSGALSTFLALAFGAFLAFGGIANQKARQECNCYQTQNNECK